MAEHPDYSTQLSVADQEQVMRQALEAIQETHKPVLTRFGSTVCPICDRLHPCPTRKLADEALTDRMARTNQGENK